MVARFINDELGSVCKGGGPYIIGALLRHFSLEVMNDEKLTKDSR